jgi:hypothetical protein
LLERFVLFGCDAGACISLAAAATMPSSSRLHHVGRIFS